MSKSIEERANKFALEKHPYSPFYEEYAKMYIEIATEQEAITKKELIEKACELFRKECEEANGLIKSVCDRNIGDLINVDASVKTFRKKLEE